jgi:hypothetical protein
LREECFASPRGKAELFMFRLVVRQKQEQAGLGRVQ